MGTRSSGRPSAAKTSRIAIPWETTSTGLRAGGDLLERRHHARGLVAERLTAGEGEVGVGAQEGGEALGVLGRDLVEASGRSSRRCRSRRAARPRGPAARSRARRSPRSRAPAERAAPQRGEAGLGRGELGELARPARGRSRSAAPGAGPGSGAARCSRSGRGGRGRLPRSRVDSGGPGPHGVAVSTRAFHARSGGSIPPGVIAAGAISHDAPADPAGPGRAPSMSLERPPSTSSAAPAM